jgi:hypothetical protein
LFALIHEGFHILVAVPYGEYRDFLIKPYGFEVVFKTPTGQRTGVEWLFISGTSNIVTVLLGYALLSQRRRIAQIKNSFLQVVGYWLTLLLLLIDPLNISLGPFLYGGDAEGIRLGLEIDRIWVQLLFFLTFLVNRELVAQKLLPAFGVRTKHPLFVPWFKRGKGQKEEMFSKS